MQYAPLYMIYSIKAARIVMDSTYNTFSLVNDGLKCIILVDGKGLEQEKAPFLNRFEKHIISFEYLKERNIDLKCNVKHLLINCDKEEIKGITYNIYSEYKK